MSESLEFINLNNFFKNTDSFRNKTGECRHEWVIETFTQLIHDIMRTVYLHHCQLKLLPIQIKITKKCSDLRASHALQSVNQGIKDMDDCSSEFLPASLFIHDPIIFVQNLKALWGNSGPICPGLDLLAKTIYICNYSP